jgi:methyltransferase (TIGR00027 family)
MEHQPEVPAQLTGVSATALGVALLRAEETHRPDRLFDDPHAQRFLDCAGVGRATWAITPPDGALGFFELMAGQVAVRTRFLDEALLQEAEAGCTQVVLLAAGMDTRAFRLDWPAGTRLFETDFADVLGFKQSVLREHAAVARCSRVEVPVDLRDDWPTALTEAGLQPDRPTAWLIEGILYALPPGTADFFLDRITASSAPGSVLALDHIEDSELLRAARAAISPELLTLWKGGPTGDLAAWLRRHGWQPDIRDVAAVAAAYRRPTPPAFSAQHDRAARGWLATARLGPDRPTQRRVHGPAEGRPPIGNHLNVNERLFPRPEVPSEGAP